MCYHNDESRSKILQVISWSMEALGRGIYPLSDPWGKEFSKTYEPARFKKAGQLLVDPGSGRAAKGIFDGIQADLEFVKKILFLQRISTAFDYIANTLEN
ncbi:unnamed protein product [Symbiodinium sp. CCMP2456]|nr:unnamed protein product [Symbiodinium sp. CCMP2456]